MSHFDMKLGWWVRLKNGAAGRLTFVAPTGKPGIRVQIDEAGSFIEATKSAVVSRENPNTYSAPHYGFHKHGKKPVLRELDVDA